MLDVVARMVMSKLSRKIQGRTRGVGRVPTMVDGLEARVLLSAAGHAFTNLAVTHATAAKIPGLTPAAVRQAYGFNQINFGTVAGDGTGQTIAVVDAYADPMIAADLH